MGVWLCLSLNCYSTAVHSILCCDRVLECLNRYSIKGGHPLIDIMFNRRPITPSRLHSFDCDDIHLFNTNLDHSQRKALAFALSREDIAIIHGPPGTGKTTTVVELILQVVARGSKVSQECLTCIINCSNLDFNVGVSMCTIKCCGG